MNEYFIEEENTIYEIDPYCTIEPIGIEKEQREKTKCQKQSEKDKKVSMKKNSQCCGKGCSFCKIIFILCLICPGHQRMSDRRPQHIRCR